MTVMTAEQRGDLVEALIPDAAGLVVDVHEGSAADIAARLRGLSRHELETVAVVLAAMADPEQTLRQALGWITFDEAGERLEGGPEPVAGGLRDVARVEVQAGPIVDEVAVRRALEPGRPVVLNQRERRMAVCAGVRRGLKHEDIAGRLGMSRDAVQRTWERAKKRAREEGVPLVPVRRAG